MSKPNITFQPEPNDFFKDLRSQVIDYLKKKGSTQKADYTFFIKLIILTIIYGVLYYNIITTHSLFTFYMSYALMGALSIIMGLNIGHDAAHNAIFKKNKHNEWLLHVFELFGTSSKNWKHKHIFAHHKFPNIMGYDSDIQQSNVVKIFPNDKHKFFHNFQYLYMPFLYMFYLLRWAIYRDFKDASSSSESIGVPVFSKKEFFKLLFFKLFYFSYIILLPAFMSPFSIWASVLGFFTLTVFGSLTLTLVLLSTHVGSDTEFVEPDQQGNVPYSWSHHIMRTTSDFATQSWFLTHLFGGFNHHIFHHLFPSISHVHYYELTPILKKVAKQYDLPYRENKRVVSAIWSHFKLLYQNSKQDSLREIIAS